MRVCTKFENVEKQPARDAGCGDSMSEDARVGEGAEGLEVRTQGAYLLARKGACKKPGPISSSLTTTISPLGPWISLPKDAVMLTGK